jgi:osmoprotectant transport system permease protein
MIEDVWRLLTDPAAWQGPGGFLSRIAEHLSYVTLALLVAAFVAVPVGCLVGHTRRGVALAVNAGNAARSLPTLGLLTLVVLLTGLGTMPVLTALVVLAVPPLLTATYAGVAGVSPGTLRAARGMGMTGWQLLSRVELPTALPLILSGLRSAALQTIATATIAAYVSLGGLGRYVVDGFAVRAFPQMLAGAVLVAVLALGVDAVLAVCTRLLVSPGLRSPHGRTRLPTLAGTTAGKAT